MRAVIYTALNDAYKNDPLNAVDPDTAVFDRQIEADIKERNERRRTHPEQDQELEPSWNDYLPVLVIEVTGATIEEGILCFGGMSFTAEDVLRNRAEHAFPFDVETIFLNGGRGGTLGVG